MTRDILAVDQDAPALHVVEALQQREQSRLAAARLADQADALARLDAQVEVRRRRCGRRDSRNETFSNSTLRAALDQRRRLRMVAQLVRDQQRCERLRQPGHVLGHVDQRHRQIARGVQDRKSERA